MEKKYANFLPDKYIIFFFAFIFFTTFSSNISYGVEIILKNGRTISTDTYWIQDGRIMYEKYGATIGVKENDVKEIIDDETEGVNEDKKINYGNGVIILKTGESIISSNIWEQDGVVYYDTEQTTMPLDKKTVQQIANTGNTYIETGNYAGQSAPEPKSNNYYPYIQTGVNSSGCCEECNNSAANGICIKGNCINGFGVCRWNYDSRTNRTHQYSGFWMNGMKHGQGVFSCLGNANKCRGIWSNDILSRVFTKEEWDYLIEAQGEYSIGNYSSAEVATRRLLKKDPGNLDGILLRVKCSVARSYKGDNKEKFDEFWKLGASISQEQIDNLTDYLTFRPYDLEALWLRAIAYYFRREYTLASGDCKQILLQNPDNANVLLLLARIENSPENFEAAIKVKPDWSVAYYYYALYMQRSSNDLKVIKSLFEKAIACSDNGLWDEAIEHATEVVEKDYYLQLKTENSEILRLYDDGKIEKGGGVWQRILEASYPMNNTNNKTSGYGENVNHIKSEDKEKSGYTGKAYSSYPNGQNKLEFDCVDGLKSGEYKTWYDNGQAQMTANFKNGVQVGKMQVWHKNGELIQKAFYKNGKYDGKISFFYSNGNERLVKKYKNGNENGDLISWYSNSKLKSESKLKNGKFDGEYTFWYSNGQKGMNLCFKDGLKHGDWEFWDIDGEKTCRFEYKNNLTIKIFVYNKTAKEWLNIAETFDLDKFDYWYEKGKYFDQNKDYVNSFKSFLIALSIDQKKQEIYLDLGKNCLDLELFRLAEMFFKEHSKKEPESVSCLAGLVSSFGSQGRDIEARDLLEKLCDLGELCDVLEFTEKNNGRFCVELVDYALKPY